MHCFINRVYLLGLIGLD